MFLNRKKIKYFVLFLCINFITLALGSWLMNNEPKSVWYLSLNKAPWTPPGWSFGVAWSLIMICFAFYLATLFSKINNLKIWFAYTLQIVLNIGWNYAFFNQHKIITGFIILIFLMIILCYFFISFRRIRKLNILLLPYLIWLCIAISLNFYILIYN